MFNPQIKVTINGRPYSLALDMAALICLQKEFSIGFEDLSAILKGLDKAKDAAALEVLMRLVYAMAQSNDEPPTYREVCGMGLADVLLLVAQVRKAAQHGFDLGMPSGKNEPAIASTAARSVSRGIGTRHSSRRSTGSASRRRNSAD